MSFIERTPHGYLQTNHVKANTVLIYNYVDSTSHSKLRRNRSDRPCRGL